MKKINVDKYALLKIISFSFVSILVTIFIMYVYDYAFNYNTIMFIILIPIMILPFFLTNDLMHPFNIFLITSQFLFVFNMIDINANKDSFRYGSLSSSYHDIAFFWAILVILVWYVLMYLGYFYSKNIKSKYKINILFKIYNIKSISIILILIGIISYTFIVFLKGGFSGLIEALTGRVEAYAGLAYFIKLTGLTAIGAIMLLGIGYKKTSLILILASFLMLASFGGRAGAFFGSIFPYLVFYHYQVRRLKIIKLVPLAIATIIFAIGLGNYRLYRETRINFSGFYDLLSNIANNQQGGEILPSLIGSLMNGNIDYQFGSTFVNIIFAPIPSSLWPNKPQIDESGIVGKALMGSEYWGLPPGPYGISFFNFGFIGVILFAFLTGVFVQRIYYRFILTEANSEIGKIFYVLIISSVFNIVSTSSQISILWYVNVFIMIKLMDILIFSLKNKQIRA